MAVVTARLPHHAYIDPQFHAEEQATVFRNAWRFIGLSDADPPAATVEHCGKLVFSSEDAPCKLADWLEPYADWLATATSETTRVAKGRHVVRCNWKLLVENTLDDCHGGTLHAGSLQQSFPDWRHDFRLRRNGGGSDIRHRLGERDRGFWSGLVRRLRLKRFGPDDDYRHVFVFPNCYVATFFDAMTLVHRIEPVDAENSLLSWDMLLRFDAPPTGAKAILMKAAVAELVRQAEKVLAEDLAICVLAQRGRHIAVHPGLLCEREIRIADFQERLLQAMSGRPYPQNR